MASGAVSVGVFPGCLVGAIRAAPMRGAWQGACRASRGGLSWLHLSHKAWRRQSNDRLCLLLITWAWARLWATSMRGAWGGCLTGLLWVPSRSKLMRGLGIWLGRGWVTSLPEERGKRTLGHMAAHAGMDSDMYRAADCSVWSSMEYGVVQSGGGRQEHGACLDVPLWGGVWFNGGLGCSPPWGHSRPSAVGANACGRPSGPCHLGE